VLTSNSNFQPEGADIIDLERLFEQVISGIKAKGPENKDTNHPQ